jgi:hypothetical protein
VADGGEDSVCGVAVAAFEMAAAEVALGLHVSDDRLDRPNHARSMAGIRCTARAQMGFLTADDLKRGCWPPILASPSRLFAGIATATGARRANNRANSGRLLAAGGPGGASRMNADTQE